SSAAKLLIVLVPRVGVEPTRPYGQRILRTLQRVSPSVTKRYEPVFTRLAVVKVSLRLATYQHVRPPSWPHLSSGKPRSLLDLISLEMVVRRLKKQTT